MEPHILYQDDHMVVLTKPAQMVVNSADSAKGQHTLQDWVEERLAVHSSQFTVHDEGQYVVDGYNKFDEFIARSGIVHRLDKETSGIILVALTPEAFISLQSQFKNGVVKKTYMALLHGKLMPLEGEIDAPVGRLPWNRMRFGVLNTGRPAQTSYKVLQHMQLRTAKEMETFSYVEVYPQTGRTHQIRVHFQHLGHPIVSDALYAGRKIGKADRQSLPRHFLHASKITLQHPLTLSPLEFVAPLPDDLRIFLEGLEKIA